METGDPPQDLGHNPALSPKGVRFLQSCMGQHVPTCRASFHALRQFSLLECHRHWVCCGCGRPRHLEVKLVPMPATRADVTVEFLLYRKYQVMHHREQPKEVSCLALLVLHRQADKGADKHEGLLAN